MKRTCATLSAIAILAPIMVTAPIIAATPPNVGECYNFSAAQNKTVNWLGEAPVPCNTPHTTEIVLVQPLTVSSQQVEYRHLLWTCQQAMMNHGPLTRLNGGWSWRLLNTGSAADGSPTVMGICGVSMRAPKKSRAVATTTLWGSSASVSRDCYRWNRKSGKAFRLKTTTCKRGTYALSKWVLLDTSFKAKFPGAKKVARRSKSACRTSGHFLYQYPSRANNWKWSRSATCFTQVK